ncbi:MAG: flippase-like domain-containing protein [Ferruginibacter sp.]|nr:flippase-like domain-containing protein [Ferruginibacter sp.]
MNKSIKITINYFFGPLLFLVLSWSLYRQISNQPDLPQRWAQISIGWKNWKFWLVIILMFVNWGIETKKWQILVHHVQQFSFIRAFKSVLSGCSVTMLTPNRIGEYGGRILYVEEENRIKAISLSLVGSISQLLVTMVMGCTGLLYLRYLSHSNGGALAVLPEFWGDVLIYLSIGITIMLLLFYLRLGWLVRTMERLPTLQKIVNHIRVLDQFNNRRLVEILLLSFIRYLVFVFQYVLMLQVMQIEIAVWLSFWLMTAFYLVMAVAPSIGFIELPVRVSASWVIFKLYTSNELGVGTASLGIWLINLVIPAVIGSLLILSIKIVKEK